MQPSNRSQKLSSSAIPFAVVEAEDYYQQLVERIPHAKERIVLVAMAFLWGPKTDVILAELEKAAQRGVSVHVLIDIYTTTGVAHGSMPSGERRVRLAKTQEYFKDLQKSGGYISKFGKIGLNPFKGRCHVKIIVIDNECYSFGGVNFTDESFTYLDYMLQTRNGELADCLEQLAIRIGGQTPPLPNGEVIVDNESSILFDGGQPKHSLIYDRACDLAAQATHIYAASQMVPSGRLGELIRRKQSEIYYNRPGQLSAPTRWAQAFDEQKHRLTNQYTKKHFIHAKFMLFEMPNGERWSISGSHNFSYRGVAFGTQEIALLSSNTELWDQLHSFLRNHLS